MSTKIKILAIVILASNLFSACMKPTESTTTGQSIPPEIKQKVKEVMSKMELVDKVGEMTQFTIDMITVGTVNNVVDPIQLDTTKMRRLLLDYRVGSILNVGGHARTVEEWRHIIKSIQDMAVNEKPTGIPVLYGIDSYHGANYVMGSTLFPQPLALGASWNPKLVEKTGIVTAYESRAAWIPWNFMPALDIARDPRWPRFWENFSEDVHLLSQLGVAYIKGNQGDDLSNPERAVVSLKHYLGYSMPVSGKDRTQALIPERQLREFHVPPFKAAIEAGGLTVMVNSGEINGVPTHCNRALLTGLLKEELGFKGLVVSDWDDITNLQTRHRVAHDYKEAIELAINAGIDMVMVPFDTTFPVLLKELAEEGRVPISRINDAVERILTVKFMLGLFEHPYHADYDYSKFASPESKELSFQAALETVVLLKNENNTLPLTKGKNVLVAGPTANIMSSLNGGWNRTWQGNHPEWDLEEEQKTVLEAIQDKIGAANVTYAEGTGFDKVINIQQAVQAAGRADVIVVCLGENSYAETPGDLDDLDIGPAQRELVNALAKTGKPIIGILIQGRPRLINGIDTKMKGILNANLPGNEGGRALAEILFGDYNPNGKLPYTYNRYPHALLTYDHRLTDTIGPLGYKPQFEFGHGLSYTTFAYSGLKLSSNEFDMKGSITVEVLVKNTGQRTGKEVVQLYVSDKVASITPSIKRLRGFQKISLEPGESKTVSFTIKPADLAFIGLNNHWITEPGEFEFNIGGLKETAILKNKQ